MTSIANEADMLEWRKAQSEPRAHHWRCMHAQEYKIHNAELLFKEDASVDDLIDVIEGNRRYVRCLYVYNKVDVCSIEEIDTIARLPNSVPASAGTNLNMDGMLASIWTKMALVRVYTKRVRPLP